MVEKQIELIKKQVDILDSNEFDLGAWKSSTIVVLSRIFGDNYQGVRRLEDIRYSSANLGSGLLTNLASCKKQGKDILEACITELETYGQPDKKEKDNSGIKINLTQNQTVNINLLKSALEDELTGSQLREVYDLMKIDELNSVKKRKIMDKLKSFGSDVASNILSNILTNPTIWRNYGL